MSSDHQNPPSPRPLSPGVAGTASRLLFSMRKSFSHSSSSSLRRKTAEHPRAAGMYSTPEERHPYNPLRAARSRHPDTSSGRPTIEQIAMGLHVSRTPHLRPIGNPLQRHSVPSSPSRRHLSAAIHAPDHLPLHPYDPHGAAFSALQHRTRQSLPPPPSRSSMKRSSASSSPLAPPQLPFISSRASPSTFRMSKLIPGYRPSSASSPATSSLGRTSSFTSSGSNDTRPTTPRKAVRFSTSVLALDEQSS
ncbi:hypothetical protein BU15DRAFT_87579 [Melanogaster broomeanus]|nr:hypothetical protein BU15DRAFT_87579 [Melanogaster broomeanus]